MLSEASTLYLLLSVSSIYDVTSTLTQTALDTFCQKYHIHDNVHPELPGPNQNIHNSPTGKIGVYTSFPSLLLPRDPSPTAAEFSAEACDFVATHPALFQKFSEPFLCLVGLSRYYDLDDNVYATFLTGTGKDFTKARIGERNIKEGQVPLLDSIEGRVIPLAGEDSQAGSVVRVDHGGQNDNVEKLNEGSGDADKEDHSEDSDRAGQDEAVTIVVGEEFWVAVADKLKSKKKKRIADGASGSDHPPKKLRKNHDTSGDVGASTVATVPFVTSFVTPTPEREGDNNTDSVFGTNLRTQRPSKRLVIFSDSSHHSSTNAADAEVTFVVRSLVSPSLMTASVATIVVAGTSSASIYVPKWNVVNGSVLDDHDEQNSALEEEKNALERKVATPESATAAKEIELADGLANQVSLLETTCSGLHDQVSGYELFKEQCEAIQDGQVKVLSDHVEGLDFELMALALHLDGEFYPHFLTTIAGRRWIIGHGLRLAIMKCHQSLRYGTAFGAVIGLAIGKGIQIRLVAGINHEKAGWGLVDVASYDPSGEALLVRLRSLRLQPSYEQLLLPIHRKEDYVIIRETSLSDSLDVVHARVKKLKEGALSHRLSISDAMGVLADPLSSENLIGEASTSRVPVMAAITTTLDILVTATNISSILPIW
uniref:Transposase (Putative), gypsy type n=1 Tax=Tanacetum cinerariifolium TaxID=118510 RepID=A0A6L2K6Z2_TANCI|nr:hypothetical protein [Tanacetum cinerariifolium]